MQDEVKLNPGDSAVIVRHDDAEDGGFEIEIYHRSDENLSEEDLVFYTLLTRGMAFQATNDMEAVLDMGRESFEETELVITQH
jgi:hypothetical protein